MTKKLYDVCHGREYEKGGETKTAWSRVGVLVMAEDGRIAIRLDAVPAGAWDGWLKVFPREENDKPAPAPAAPPPKAKPAFVDMDDDIPF
jgi:hypothetical protein